jgi:MFS family permease
MNFLNSFLGGLIMSQKERIGAVFNKSMISMIVMVVLIGLGEKMAERFLPIYLLALGGSIYAVGASNAIDNLLSALYSFPGGYLSDRLGYKKALMVFNVISLLGYAIVIMIPTWQAVFVGSILFISWTAISLPAIMSMVSKAISKDKRAMGVSIHSLVRRIPMAIGPLLGGLLIYLFGEQAGIRAAFIAAFVLGVAALFFVYFYMEEEKKEESKLVSAFDFKYYFSPSLRNLLASDILIRFAEQIPYAFVVIWVIKYNGLTPWQFGVLTTIEMVTALLVYIPVAYFADKYTKKPFVLITFGFFTLFPLVLFYSKSFWGFVLAFIIRGLKEFGEPTRKSLIMDLAPEDAKARTFGTYYLIRDIVVAAAAFSSAYLWDISPQANFMTAFGFGLAGMILFAIFGKDLKGLEKENA